MVYPLNISVTKDIVTIFDRKHPLFLSETTSCVYIEKFILASGFKHVKRFLGVFYLRCKILIKSDISMNDCYLNFLVSFRALFSLDVGANLVNSKQTIGIILPDLSLLGYAVPVESFGIGLFVILFAYLIIEYNVQLLSHEKFKIAMNMLHTAHTPLILLRNQLEELKTGNLPEPLSQQVEEALGYAECIIYCNRNIATLNKVNKRIPPKTSTVNLELSTYVTSIVNQCRAHANSRQIRLTVGECSDCVSCRINENIMTAALQHLINKMILISESGCCISINVTHTMNSWQLQISNNEIAGQRAGKMFPFIPIIFPVYGYSDLWTVRKIIRLHGGKITGCRHGKAATFQIVIPTDCHCQNQSCPVLKHSSAKTKTQIDDSCESPKSDKQNTKARETSHILLVMADKLFSDYLKKTLSRYFQISVLDNPELLINTAISQNPDAIIIDDNVNGISGDTLSTQIKENKMMGYIPIILLRVLSEENEISFTFQLPDEPIMVWADKEKMSIVIRNIISNAFKFTHSGGSIYITTGLTDDGKRCYVRVEDNGVGIPQNKLTEIFERFSQGENAKNSYYQGTGIGLALSKEIVNLHHGQIRAESPEGQGAVFIVELLMDKEHYRPSEVDFYVGDTETAPVSVEQDPVANAISEDGTEEEPEIDASLPTLLLVEDNKDLCQLIKLQLEDKFNIHIANNGVEGLKKVHLYHPDIVVTDQMMPEMDGLEMLQSIRKDFQISHIPVIILTAKNDEGAKTKAITLGANAYITKPFSKEYLLARIDQLLAERKLFRERIRQQMENQTTTEEDSYEQFLVKKDVQFLEKIHQVIEENMDDSDFNIDTIASGIGLSRSAFFKKLKSLTGLAPVDLVKEIRLNKSIELIKNTDLSVSEIAFAVGFKDSGYYSKCFRKKYNQSPREYMNEWRKGER